MKSLPFGLDIGATTVKAVWLKQDKTEYFLNAYAMVPTPQRGMMSESELDQQEMASVIHKIVTDAKITTPYVNIALPENQVYTRVLEVPELSDKELSTAIYWIAEQYIPIPLPEITFDYKILKKTSEGSDKKMQLLLVGAPNVLIDRYQKIITYAGLTISTIETEILSTMRSLIVGDQAPPTLIVVIGALSTALAIVKEGVIIFTYSIPLGGTAISRAIAADFGFTISQAEEYKKTYGISDKNFQGKIGKASEPILMSILTEVKKALAFYTDKYKEQGQIQQILLSGGTAKLPGLTLFFTENCGVETAIANPLKMLANQELSKDLLDNATDYTIAVGLAMKEHEY